VCVCVCVCVCTVFNVKGFSCICLARTAFAQRLIHMDMNTRMKTCLLIGLSSSGIHACVCVCVYIYSERDTK